MQLLNTRLEERAVPDKGDVPFEIETFWSSSVTKPKDKNPLNIGWKTLDESKKNCTYTVYDNATYLGRYLVPREYIRYNEEEQPRDKNNNPDHVNQLLNDFQVYGYDTTCHPIICCFDEQNRDPHHLRGQAGFNRSEVYDRLGQEVIIADIYKYDSKRSEIVVRNRSNHHRHPSDPQTTNDYVKDVCNAVDEGTIEHTKDAISDFVDEIACDRHHQTRESIKRKTAKNTNLYPNFRTYSSQTTKKTKNTLVGFLDLYGFPKAGIDGRTDDNGKSIKEQGYIIYLAGEGGNKASWMRGISNSTKYDIPTWIFGYANERKPCLKSFREKWVEDFIELKELILQFSGNILEDCDVSDYSENNFPIKFGGFLCQYVKPNPKDGGRPTEIGLVDVHGNSLKTGKDFDPKADCLTTR